ncbi:rho GTPase-activating protein 18-like isoform X2 [Drosophila hydei]|uniref:Rho GTPase-activating protein 18-like isoform X2 n=1 Tax=Drosophila hydei TaxID=7224 RepID=A0A6J1LRJ8_DROHY|nr:rho GTPase-activating protein 18-like isoform X2 [Drosophila hydei]
MSGSDLLSAIVLNDLKEIGIKHKGKKPKIIKNSSGQRLFHQGLEHLKLTDAFLASGTVVQVPQFITEACSYILENSETEGIFRKAGSAAKQREIRKYLEAGQPLGKLYRVIDVANIVSYFFRELPEPLIPVELHETLVRCLMIGEPNRIRSIQLACLLITPLNVHTLAYFMQFLQTITRHVKYNKMSAENLAIVIAPSVMPYRDINSVRFKNHIKLVELLIKNSNIIGTIPSYIKEKLKNTSNSQQTKKSGGVNCSAIKSKMRRSHIFNGLKTIVGSSANATGHVHSSPKSDVSSRALHKAKSQQNFMFEPMDTSSGIATNTEAFTKSESAVKENKDRRRRSNLFAGNEGSIKPSSCPSTLSGTDRRWSLISTGWTKSKKKEKILQNLNISVSDTVENKDPISETKSKLEKFLSSNSTNLQRKTIAEILIGPPCVYNQIVNVSVSQWA